MHTFGVFFMFVNAIKLVPYAWLGQFSAANLGTSLVLAPLVPLGGGSTGYRRPACQAPACS
jgi:hypothetical protein